MLHKLETTAVVNQGVTSNASFLMVSLRESAIYHHQLAACLDRVFATRHMHRHMTIYDVTIRVGNAEGVHYRVANILTITQGEEVALSLVVCLLFVDEIALKCSHLRFVKQWTIWSAP